MEVGFWGPAASLESLADFLFYIGSEGTGTVVVFVISLTGEDVDEAVLDGALDTARHVVIDGGETDGHADRLIVAEQRTIGTLHQGIVEVDTMDEKPVLGIVAAENAVETVHTKRTDCAVADFIFFSVFCEDLLSGLRS